MTNTIANNKRWWALAVLCLGQLMIVLDTTIVNVALPSIRSDLGFSEITLAWVINAYMLTFGGFLLLGGRLGDLFGHRKIFLIGITAFTAASLACGLASTQWFLIIARALQGVGGALLAAVALSVMMNLFTEPNERTKAMGFFGFVAAGGGSLGVLLGGFLTGNFNWHWIFLVNIPVGILVFTSALKLLPKDRHDTKSNTRLDLGGALTITTSLMLAVYGIVNGVFVALIPALALFIIFLVIESKVHSPLIPLGLFKLRNIAVSNIVGVLWSAGMFSWFFLSALYLQLVLGYNPQEVGLSFLPANLIMATFSIGLSAKLVMKFGTKKPLAVGLFLASIGLLLLARAPVEGNFVAHVLPSMILLGFGAGMAFNPMLLNAMSDAPPDQSGLASGLVNTSFMMGGALGLAILARIASSHTEKLLTLQETQLSALTSGYHVAFLAGAISAALGATIAATFLKQKNNIESDTSNLQNTH